MDEHLLKIIRALAERCVEAQTEIVALRVLLVTKGIISKEEADQFIRIAEESRCKIARQASQSPSEALAELLEKFQGPPQ